VIVFVTLALLESWDYNSRAYRDLLKEENQTLQVEMTLFEQQLWAARRNWSLVVHGTVQASLTAALTRLNAPDADKKTLDFAKKDLERAIAALTNPPTTDLKISSAIKELVATWQGVCEIDIQIEAAPKKIIGADSRLSMCVNEILKEAVSNAVRHGDARRVGVEVKLLDGRPPMIDRRHGLGSSLLDELTVNWQLAYLENRDQTVLFAHLPFSGSQA
jgi:signal transduction histidine kinase